ncbi:hypothetical protein FJZ28_00315 [Candidatus Peregrinibacteria bacterium]|nr:hypothetical protein [Candidatus Peregrinibacteria bacterium]
MPESEQSDQQCETPTHPDTLVTGDWTVEQRQRFRAAVDELYGLGNNPHSDLPASAQNPSGDAQNQVPENAYEQANEAARERHEDKVNDGRQQDRKKAKYELRKLGRRL